MSNFMQGILMQKLMEIQNGLPSYVKIIKDNTSSFDEILNNEINETNATDANNIPSEKTSGDYSSLIDSSARKYNLNSSIIKAVIQAESGYDPNAVSNKGAMGLMQLMPNTAKGLGVDNAFDPAENIEGGTKFLKGLLEEFGGNLELALAAYNAGAGSVRKYGGIPPYEETQNYVKKIMANLSNRK